jgi:hypothetical protein
VKEESIMNRMLIATLFSILIASAAIAGSPAADVRLVLDESSVLPGTPTGLTVIVTNRGEEELQLPIFLWLTARNESGQTFRVRRFNAAGWTNDSSEIVAAVVPEPLRTIPAGASRELRFDPSSVIFGSPWFTDASLSTPGRYRLRAVLAPDVKRDGTFDAATALVSNEETLTTGVTSDEDAAVWQWMRTVGGSKWGEAEWTAHSRELATFVMKNHPQSQYALFTAVFLPLVAENEPSPTLAEQTKRFPNKSYTDQLKLLIVHYLQQTSSVAYRRHDLYRAANESDEARGIASQLLQNSRSSNVRASAKELLDRIPTREQLMKKPETR